MAEQHKRAPQRDPRESAGRTRRASAAEITGTAAHVGDAPIEIPPGATKTQGAVLGGGLSRDAARQPIRDADPGAETDLTGDQPPGAVDVASEDPAKSGLGDTASGGPLRDFDS